MSSQEPSFAHPVRGLSRNVPRVLEQKVYSAVGLGLPPPSGAPGWLEGCSSLWSLGRAIWLLHPLFKLAY